MEQGIQDIRTGALARQGREERIRFVEFFGEKLRRNEKGTYFLHITLFCEGAGPGLMV